MNNLTAPKRLGVRLASIDREAFSIIQQAIALQHRPAPSVSETVKAAFSMAAEAVRSRAGAGAVQQSSKGVA